MGGGGYARVSIQLIGQATIETVTLSGVDKMHTPFAGGEVVRERPFLFLVFLRRVSEGLFHVTRGGAEFRAVIEVVDELVFIAKLIVLSHGGKPFEGADNPRNRAVPKGARQHR